MHQNSGCKRKRTVLYLKDGVNIVLKFILELSLYSLVRCTPISLFFVLGLYEKSQQVHSFQDFLLIFCYYFINIIVITGICQNLFYDH